MAELEEDLKRLIIDTLELEDVSTADIDTDAPLFDLDDGLGLDSIDALEIGLAVGEKYDIEMDAEDESTREQFRTVATLATFLRGLGVRSLN